MSRESRLFREWRFQRAFEDHSRELVRELVVATVPVKYLELRVALLELLVDRTGKNQLTESYRETLRALREAVASHAEQRRCVKRRHLRAV